MQNLYIMLITCIKKDDRLNPYESITHVGGITNGGNFLVLTQETIIDNIDSDIMKCYTEAGGDLVKVITSTSPHGNKYIKTEPDETKENNLLELPECPEPK